MKILGLFHITVSRESLDEQLCEEYLRAFREGREYEAEKRTKAGPDLAYVDGMLAGLETCAQVGHTAQPSEDGDPSNARYWAGYAEGVRDGRGVSRNSGSWSSTKQRNAARRPHPHLQLVGAASATSGAGSPDFI